MAGDDVLLEFRLADFKVDLRQGDVTDLDILVAPYCESLSMCPFLQLECLVCARIESEWFRNYSGFVMRLGGNVHRLKSLMLPISATTSLGRTWCWEVSTSTPPSDMLGNCGMDVGLVVVW